MVVPQAGVMDCSLGLVFREVRRWGRAAMLEILLPASRAERE